MDEMISRVAAIDAIEKHIRTAEEPYQLTYADKVMNHAFEIAASCVYNLPATEPEVRTQMSSVDCISRSAAIDVINESNSPIAEYLIGEIMALPSAQPERKRGRWNCSDDMYESAVCSVCGWDTTEPWDHIRHWFNYCPNCGADMREVSE